MAAIEKDKVSSMEEQKEKIQDVSFAYRMHVSARRDFILGIAIGITGSLTAAYLVELDRRLFDVSTFTVPDILVRVVILLTLLVFVVRRYHARTQLYEDSLKAMSERLTEINRQLEDAKG
jgi:hypothetical protein